MNECIHGMETADCVLCNGRKPPQQLGGGVPFKARYAGSCYVCGAWFEEGSMIARLLLSESDYAHLQCLR